MRDATRIATPAAHRSLSWLWPAVVMFAVSSLVMSGAPPASAAVLPLRIDMRVLVLEDPLPWVTAIESQMKVEGVPFTTVPLGSPGRPVITDGYLASGDRAFYQAVVVNDYSLSSLSDAERQALRAYEAKFGVREVDAYNWANPAVGLNYALIVGDIAGTTATVTAAGRTNGFGYLNGPVPFSAGSWSYIAEPLAESSLPAGASFTTLVGAPLPSGATGSLIGVYSNAGVEQMVITAAFNFALPQFKLLAHGIITWATRGVHFGYNRNNFTFHVDDAFASDAIWNVDANCTPNEDCPRNPDGTSTVPEAWARMTAADVNYAVNWEQANGYQLTLSFNGAYADATNDPLTQAFRANAASFRWLNHGAEHIFQGCVQNFTAVPWQCTLDGNGQPVWTSQAAIYDEIRNNVAIGQALNLPFDPTEYLSGEHSGLFVLPQQPVDNPNFAAALSQAGMLSIGSDASRDNVTRSVGTARTIPRHPTALFYNTSTQAQAVDEYNWLYTPRADGGSGYCEDNPATATCIAPLDPATGFTSYIVPTDAAFDMNFILSNDPRPFFAHTSNMTGDRLLYPLLDEILGNYRAAFTAATPPVNLTLNQAAAALDRQTRWAATGTAAVSGYVQSGRITVTNTAGVAVPITAPVGTVINGTTLETYGGEASGWLAPVSTTGTLPATPLTITGSPAFVIGRSSTVTISATGTPTPTLSLAGALPAGVTFSANSGVGAISGIPAAGTAGTYPLTVTAISGTSISTQPIVITVSELPRFTSAASATALSGIPFSFTITTTGSPTPTITRSGSLPSGIAFTAGPNGTATLSGTAANDMAGRSFPITFTATNAAGATQQAFTLTVGRLPAFRGDFSVDARIGRSFRYTVQTVGSPPPAISTSSSLPVGLTFVDNHNGTGLLSGTPAAGTAGRYAIVFTATNVYGTATRTLDLRVRQP